MEELKSYFYSSEPEENEGTRKESETHTQRERESNGGEKVELNMKTMKSVNIFVVVQR